MNIHSTKDYSLFEQDPLNRDVRKIGPLIKSMTELGFLDGHPIVCVKHGKKLRVKDGHHRLAAAKKLGLKVFYVVSGTYADIPVRKFQGGAGPWLPIDYVGTHARAGVRDFTTLQTFMAETGISAINAAVLLGGYAAGSKSRSAKQHIIEGTFRVKHLDHGYRVAEVLNAIKGLVSFSRNGRWVAALSLVMRVPGVDPKVLASKLKSRHAVLGNQPTQEAFIEMLESVYNYRSSEPISIKFPALEMYKQRAGVNGSNGTK